MFAHIRRHQKWLWIVISGLVIISFVWYFNPNQQMGAPGAGTGGPVGSIYGNPITQKEYAEAYRESILNYLFQYGDWPEDNEFTRQMRPIERETRQRLLLIRKIKDYGIQVSDEAVADWIVQNFQDRQTKAFHKEVLERFIQSLGERRPALNRADFERYARHQVAISHLLAIAGASGKLVTPQEAEFTFRKENEKVDTKLVTLSTSNFLAQVQVTPEAVSNFFKLNESMYRLPERIQLSYVAFPASNYLAQADERLNSVTNLAQQIDAAYAQRGAAFYTDAANQQLSPEAAKVRIREEFREQAALAEARRAAYQFANELEAIPVSTNSPNPAESLENLAAAKGLHAQTTPPFDQFTGPAGLSLPDPVVRNAFRLTSEAPVMLEPIASTANDAVYMIALKNRLPSEPQSFETVQASATESYRQREAQRLMREAGNALATAITNGLAAGQQFDAIVQQAGYQPVDLPPFAKADRTIPGLPPQVDPSALSTAAFNLAPGKSSTFQPTREGGYIVFVEQFVPVSEEELKSELPQFAQELRRRSANEAFTEWFAKEMRLAQINLPGDQVDAAMEQ